MSKLVIKRITKKDLKALVTALNSTRPIVLADKYPYGNLELTTKVKTLEAQGLIQFDTLFLTWYVR
jgi:hypothetical protein